MYQQIRHVWWSVQVYVTILPRQTASSPTLDVNVTAALPAINYNSIYACVQYTLEFYLSSIAPLPCSGKLVHWNLPTIHTYCNYVQPYAHIAEPLNSLCLDILMALVEEYYLKFGEIMEGVVTGNMSCTPYLCPTPVWMYVEAMLCDPQVQLVFHGHAYGLFNCSTGMYASPHLCDWWKSTTMPRSTNHHSQNAISKDIDMWCVHTWNSYSYHGLVITVASSMPGPMRRMAWVWD